MGSINDYAVGGAKVLSASDKKETYSLACSQADVWQTVCNLSGMRVVTDVSQNISPRTVNDANPVSSNVRITVDGVVLTDSYRVQHSTTSSGFINDELLAIPVFVKNSFKVEVKTNNSNRPNLVSAGVTTTKVGVVKL